MGVIATGCLVESRVGPAGEWNMSSLRGNVGSGVVEGP